MRRRLRLIAVAVTAAGLALAGSCVLAIGRLADTRLNRVVTTAPIVPNGAARALHDRLVVADLHADTLLWDRDLLQRGPRGLADLPRLIEGRVGLQVFSVVTRVTPGPDYARPDGPLDVTSLLAVSARWPGRTWFDPYERALYQAQRFDAAVAGSGGRLFAIRAPADLARVAPGRVGGLLALEGLYPVGADLARLDALYRAGFRMAGLVHLMDGAAGGSLNGVGKGGLTPLGRDVIRRCEELGIIVDLAHASERAFDDALAIATRPMVVSHTGVRATCDRPRNLSDDQLRALARRGGLVGIGFWYEAVCAETPEAIGRAIRHAARVVGIERVALGSDFDGAVAAPFDAADLAQLTQALQFQGFDDAAIGGIMGGNARRFLAEGLRPGRRTDAGPAAPTEEGSAR